MTPAWYVPPVGVVAAAANSSGMGPEVHAAGLAAFWYGGTLFALLLPCITWRLAIRPPPVPSAGAIAVYMAPASLCFVAWGAVGSPAGKGVGYVLAVLSLLTWLRVLLLVPRVVEAWRAKANPSFASVTFPSAITATACIVAYGRYSHNSVAMAALCWLLISVATALVLAVFGWLLHAMACTSLLRPPAADIPLPKTTGVEKFSEPAETE
eukprot:CAMPEP_0179263522 /NCGR_PEP_ID=MMETSP0797-20121207/27921_1 /TAXON_ID=47934 /ORGANISM="Dinophysis acuminata, Strain DAEP01" /LENGTH=209 /DNA_ID=CAMNT_0020971681 /DNA_START=9 /DNA_END=638 /DNA_ORIENTATION=+